MHWGFEQTVEWQPFFNDRTGKDNQISIYTYRGLKIYTLGPFRHQDLTCHYLTKSGVNYIQYLNLQASTMKIVRWINDIDRNEQMQLSDFRTFQIQFLAALTNTGSDVLPRLSIHFVDVAHLLEELLIAVCYYIVMIQS